MRLTSVNHVPELGAAGQDQVFVAEIFVPGHERDMAWYGMDRVFRQRRARNVDHSHRDYVVMAARMMGAVQHRRFDGVVFRGDPLIVDKVAEYITLSGALGPVLQDGPIAYDEYLRQAAEPTSDTQTLHFNLTPLHSNAVPMPPNAAVYDETQGRVITPALPRVA
jgi:hypothetical protein